MDIKSSLAGSVVKVLAGYFAFVPNPLPPHIEWDLALANALSRADYALGKLAQIGDSYTNSQLIRILIIREAVLSCSIEGIQVTLTELLSAQLCAKATYNPRDLQEVRNYINALDYGIQRMSELPVSLRLIKEIHGKLMEGIAAPYLTPGEFRRSQNWIGAPGCTIATAKYVPPPVNELMDCLGAFETFLHDTTLPPLIHLALCHYQFEAIHPFLDGNGRVGRLLITLLCIERKLLPSPLLYLSAFFESTRNEYYRQLYSVSAYGTWHAWLVYVLNGIAVQTEDAVSRIERINALIIAWHVQLEGSSSLAKDIVTHCAGNPFVTATKVAEQFDVAFTTAQRAIQKLESLGILTQTTESKRDRLYCATKILAILEEPAVLTNAEIL